MGVNADIGLTWPQSVQIRICEDESRMPPADSSAGSMTGWA